MDTMGLIEDLQKRSGNQCELCGATGDLKVYEVPPISTGGLDGSLLGCVTCIGQLEDPDTVDPNHWRSLNESMWSEQDAVKVVAWRMLNRLRSEGWTQDLLDMMYLEEQTLVWAKEIGRASCRERVGNVAGT